LNVVCFLLGNSPASEAAQQAESINNYKNTKYCSKQMQQYGGTKHVGAEQCNNSFEHTIKFSPKMAQ